MDNKKLLGKRIKELRKSRKLTQEQLAELVDIETCSLSAVESGRHFPSFPTMEKIANYLNYDLKIFFDYEHLKSRKEKLENIKETIDYLPDEMINIIYKIINK